MSQTNSTSERPTLAELLPLPKIASHWISLLEEIRKEERVENRERQFQFAHGYLRGLVDAELLDATVLPQLRDLLIKAAAGRG